jgi:hypothetical protein
MSGSQQLWSPKVRELAPMGFTHEQTRVSRGQSGKTSRKAFADVESAHPA